MVSNYFIKHPIFASVLSIGITLAGIVALTSLPIEQYPNITPPLIQVTATYNGANAETVANDIAAPLEQQLINAENMLYMHSENAAGAMTLDLYFSIGSDANRAEVNVQNLLNQVTSQLPEEVQKEGIRITKQTPNFLLLIALQSPDGRYNEEFISNYASVNIINDISLLPGISNIFVIGQRNYSMRVWLRPDLMAELRITPEDIVRAITEQNADFGLGQFGQAPNPKPVKLTIPMVTQGRLNTPEQFENIIIRAEPSGAMVLLKDVGRVTLGAQDYTQAGAFNGKSTIYLGVLQEHGANALMVQKSITEALQKIYKKFPAGLEYSIPYDTTLFIRSSMYEVFLTMLLSACLVVLVVLLFLQSIRATLIPVLALLISMIGTFSFMYIFGFSINTLTLFGMILALGIVVDDAIVVVENIERNLRTSTLTPVEAAIEAMREVTGPIIAIVFVLFAVFIPVAFLGGIAGQLYRQFAMTILISVGLSGVVALTLSPAIAALLLRKRTKKATFASYFNKGLTRITAKYLCIVEWLLRHSYLGLTCFFGVVFLVVYLSFITPQSFVPTEDQGYLIVIATLPDAASLDRTTTVNDQIQKIARAHPGVEAVVSLTGYSIIDSVSRPNVGANFLILKNWKERKKNSLHADAIARALQKKYLEIQDAVVGVMNPPAIQGLGTVGGLEFWIENRGDGGTETLEAGVKKVLEKAKERKELSPLFCTAEFNNLQFYVDLDRYKTKVLGISIDSVYQALQTLIGSIYVNNFNKYGRVYQVIVQAEPIYREKLDNVGDIYVRTNAQQMVPLKSLLHIYPTRGSNIISHYNDFLAARILGGPNPGFTSGQAIKALEEVANEVLPNDMSYGWGGEAYQEIATGGSSSLVLLVGIVMVFLILAALYEKWSLPLAVIMGMPFGALGAFLAIWVKGMSNDIYFQIGLVTLMALAAKNAILIVEFAKKRCEEGMGSREAVLEAARLRFRAVLMTSLTFILGVIPLVVNQGAGAASRYSVGVGVLGGMITATLFTLCFVPLFFTLLYRPPKEKKE